MVMESTRFLRRRPRAFAKAGLVATIPSSMAALQRADRRARIRRNVFLLRQEPLPSSPDHLLRQRTSLGRSILVSYHLLRGPGVDAALHQRLHLYGKVKITDTPLEFGERIPLAA